MSSIYSIITLFSKIVYYVSRLIFNIDAIVVKKHLFLNFVEKYVKLKRQKESQCHYNYHY